MVLPDPVPPSNLMSRVSAVALDKAREPLINSGLSLKGASGVKQKLSRKEKNKEEKDIMLWMM